MRSLELSGTKPTPYRPLLSRILLFSLFLLLSFSSERERQSLRLAQTYFYRGYIHYTQGNYREAVREFGLSYAANAGGHYGELSYLYMGASYARLFYKAGKGQAILSAIAYLNMYPFYYKRPNYTLLQREFIGEAYTLLGLHSRARDIFLELYSQTGRTDYLLNFLYADALSDGKNRQLLKGVDPSSLAEIAYLYHLVKAFYTFREGAYGETIQELQKARSLNRYLEQEPEFLYRYAVSSFMQRDFTDATSYFEQLDRKDLYGKYSDSTNYYLTLLYLSKKNYVDARRRLEKVMAQNGLLGRLLLSQLWLFPEFLQKYYTNRNYRELLAQIGWQNLNTSYSIPAVLGLYYYSLQDRKINQTELLKLKRLNLPREISLLEVRVELGPMVQALQKLFQELSPYGKEADFLIELYTTNPHNYTLLFGKEKLARAVVYTGRVELKGVLYTLQEPLGSFLLGQLMLLEGNQEGIELIEKVHKNLQGEDRQEALFLLGLYKKRPELLESLVKESLPERLGPYLELALLELGDHYYFRGNYQKAKVYYRQYLEKAQEGDLYWLTAYRLARAGTLTKDREIIDWVVRKAEGKDNIVSKIILALWG